LGVDLLATRTSSNKLREPLKNAIALVPGDAELEKEKERISQWRRRVNG
jgi:hypothetical protein